MHPKFIKAAINSAPFDLHYRLVWSSIHSFECYSLQISKQSSTNIFRIKRNLVNFIMCLIASGSSHNQFFTCPALPIKSSN